MTLNSIVRHSQYSLDEYGLDYEDVPDLEGMSIVEFMNRTAKVSAFQMFLSKANGFKNCSDVRLQARYTDKKEEKLSDEIFPNGVYVSARSVECNYYLGKSSNY